MPTFLSDPPLTVYILFVAVAVVTGLIAAKSQSRKSVAALAVAILLLVAVVLIDRFVESPREEGVRKVHEMASAVSARDWAKVGAHVSERFDRNGKKKADLLTAAKAIPPGVQVSVKDFDRDTVEYLSDTRVRFGFMGHADQYPVYAEATFEKDPDGQFRMVGFELYDPAKRTNGPPLPVPGL